MVNGGFNCIIGNPPYVEYSKIRKDYQILDFQSINCGNLYAYVMEHNENILCKKGRTGMIIPHSALCTDRMNSVIELLTSSHNSWISSYDIRPAKLFVGVDQRLAIYILENNTDSKTHSTRYIKWNEEARGSLFSLLNFADISSLKFPNSLPKVESSLEISLWNKLVHFHPIVSLLKKSDLHSLYFHNAPRYWIRAMDSIPYFWNERGGEQASTQIKTLKNRRKRSVISHDCNHE